MACSRWVLPAPPPPTMTRGLYAAHRAAGRRRGPPPGQPWRTGPRSSPPDARAARERPAAPRPRAPAPAAIPPPRGRRGRGTPVEPDQVGRQLGGLGFHVTEPLHVALEVAERLRRVGHDLLIQQLLQPARAVAFALPAQDRRADLGAPRVHLLSDGSGDLAQEVGELVFVGGPSDRRTGGRLLRRRCTDLLGRRSFRRSAGPPVRRPPNELPRLLDIDRPVAHRLERHQAVECAQQLAHVVDVERGDRLQHALRERHPALVRLPAQDRDPGLVVRRGDVDDQPAGEAADEPLVQRLDLRGRPVAGQDDLAVGGLQRVGQPQQLGLHFPPVGEELDVVDQQQIHVEEALAVGLAVAGGDRGVKRLHELVEREVLDLQVGVDRPGGVARAPSAGGSCRVRAGRR